MSDTGFKVVKVTIFPRYICSMRNRSAVARVFRWTPDGLGEKVSCHPFTVLHFEFCKKRRSLDVWFKNKCAFNISQFARDRKLFLTGTKLMVFTCCRSRLCIELVVSLQSWLRFVGLSKCQSHGRSLHGNAYNTSDIFRGRSIIETVNWLG